MDGGEHGNDDENVNGGGFVRIMEDWKCTVTAGAELPLYSLLQPDLLLIYTDFILFFFFIFLFSTNPV